MRCNKVVPGKDRSLTNLYELSMNALPQKVKTDLTWPDLLNSMVPVAIGKPKSSRLGKPKENITESR